MLLITNEEIKELEKQQNLMDQLFAEGMSLTNGLESMVSNFAGTDRAAMQSVVNDAKTLFEHYKESSLFCQKQILTLNETYNSIQKTQETILQEISKSPLQKQAEHFKIAFDNGIKTLVAGYKSLHETCVSGIENLREGVGKTFEKAKGHSKLAGVGIAKFFYENCARPAQGVLGAMATAFEKDIENNKKCIEALTGFEEKVKESKLGKGLRSLKNRFANAKEGFKGNASNINSERELNFTATNGFINIFEKSVADNQHKLDSCCELISKMEKNINRFAGKEAELRSSINAMKGVQFEDMDKLPFKKEQVIAASKGTVRFVPENHPEISIEVEAKNITSSGDTLAANFDRNAKVNVYNTLSGQKIDTLSFKELNEKYINPKKSISMDVPTETLSKNVIKQNKMSK